MPRRSDKNPFEKIFLVVVVGIVGFCLFSGWYTIAIPWGWYRSTWGLLNILFAHFMMTLIFANYFKAHFTDPGRIPEGWVPDFATDEERHAARQEEMQYHEARRTRKFVPRKRQYGPYAVKWCYQCEEFKPPRAHHCRDCGKCTLKMDHHCPWVATCVGNNNHKFFLAFLCSACVGLTYAALNFAVRLIEILSVLSVHARARADAVDTAAFDALGLPEGLNMAQIIFVTTSMCIIVPITLSLWCLFGYQVSLVCRNLTTIEEYEHRILKRRAKKNGERFIWHYSMGCKRNWEQVFGDSPLQWFLPVSAAKPLDGLSWPTNSKFSV